MSKKPGQLHTLHVASRGRVCQCRALSVGPESYPDTRRRQTIEQVDDYIIDNSSNGRTVNLRLNCRGLNTGMARGLEKSGGQAPTKTGRPRQHRRDRTKKYPEEMHE